MTEARCDPLARTAFPGLPPTLSWTCPSPLQPPQPTRLPSENPASRVVAWSAVGEAAPYRMAMTWDMETLLRPRPRGPHIVIACTGGQHRAEVWVFFWFFPLDSSSFVSKMGY